MSLSPISVLRRPIAKPPAALLAALDRQAISGSAPRRLAWNRLVPPWPFLVALAVFARLLAARTALLNDPDTYLHIAAGRWIIAHRALPLHDSFSHSLPNAPWAAPEWLAEVVVAAVYDAFGWSGVILIAAATIAAAVGLLMHFLLRRLPPLPALVAGLAGAALLLPHALARPHALALPLLVLWTGLLLGSRDDGRAPPFVALPIVILWANLHGSFLFGLALAGFLSLEAVFAPPRGSSRLAELRRWGGFALAAVLAALLTPHGVAGLTEPFRLMQMPALQTIFIEWRSPDFQQSPALELWLLGAVFVGFASGVRLPLTRMVLLVGLIHMALQHTRHSDLLAIAGPLAAAGPLGGRLAVLGQSRLSAALSRLTGPPGLPALVLALTMMIGLSLPIALHPVLRGDDSVTPAAALAVAERLGLSRPVFNSEAFGGYLIFRGVPPFIDGRVEMYGNDFLADDYRAESGDAPALKALLARYRIGWTLLIPQAGAVRVMDSLPGWERVYADGYAVVHRRSDAAAR